MPAHECARNVVAQLATSKKLITQCELARARALREMIRLVISGAKHQAKTSDTQAAWRDLQTAWFPFARATRRLARTSIRRQHDELDMHVGLKRNLGVSMHEEVVACRVFSDAQSKIDAALRSLGLWQVVHQCIQIFVTHDNEATLRQAVIDRFNSLLNPTWINGDLLDQVLAMALRAKRYDRRVQDALCHMDGLVEGLRGALSLPEEVQSTEQQAVRQLEVSVAHANAGVLDRLRRRPSLYLDPTLANELSKDDWGALRTAADQLVASVEDHMHHEAKACQVRWHESLIHARKAARMVDGYGLDDVANEREACEQAVSKARAVADLNRKTLLKQLACLKSRSEDKIEGLIEQVAKLNVNNHIYHLGAPVATQYDRVKAQHRLSQAALDRLQTFYVCGVKDERWQGLSRFLCCLLPTLAVMLALTAFWPAALASVAVWVYLAVLLGVGGGLTWLENRYALFKRHAPRALVVCGMVFAMALSLLVVPSIPSVLAAGMVGLVVWKVAAAVAFAIVVPTFRALYQTIRESRPMHGAAAHRTYFFRLVGCAILMMPAMMFAMPGALVALASALASISLPVTGAVAYLSALGLGVLLSLLIIAAVQGVGVVFGAIATECADRGMDRMAALLQGVGEALAAFGPTVWGPWVIQVISHGIKVVAGLVSMGAAALAWGQWRAIESHRHDHADVPEPTHFEVREASHVDVGSGDAEAEEVVGFDQVPPVGV